MNKKQFLILVVLVVVLGLWGFKHRQGQTSSWTGGGPAAGKKLLGEFDVNAVAQIAIKQGTNILELVKKEDLWRVAQRDHYPANFAEISSLLLKLKELKVVQTEAITSSQLSRLELAASGTNAPTIVEFRDASGKISSVLTLGKKHLRSGGPASPMEEMGGDAGGVPDGRYVQVSGASNTVALISDPLTDVTADAGHWLNKNFFKVEKPKSISVTFPEATNSWTISRETESGDWKLADAKPEEKLDSGKSASVTSPFSSPSLNDVALGLTPEQTGLDKPTLIKISTFEGYDYTVKVGVKKEDNYFLTATVSGNFPKERPAVADEKPEAKTKADQEFAANHKRLEEKLATEAAFGKWTYQIANWTVDPLLKPRNELLESKSADAPKAEDDHAHDSPAPLVTPGS